MEKIIQKKKEADHTFEGQVNTSKQDVTDLRKCLEKKLDDICKILYAKIDEERLAYCEEMSGKMDTLKERLKNMRALKSSLILAKENGTNLQIFLCLGVFEESLSKQESFLSTSLEKGDFNNKEISFKPFDDIKNALKVEHLGKIEIKTNSLEVFTGSLSQSPWIQGKSKHNFKVNIDNVKLVKKKEMKFSNVKVTSCAILPNGSFLFTDFSDNKRLMLYDGNCTLLRYIPTERPPFGIAILNQSTIATTLPSAKKVLFLEILSDDKIVKQISLLGECFGIDCSGNRLAIAVKGYGIQIFSIDGSLLKTIQFSCTILSFNGSYIYYIPGEQKELKCCDDNGQCIWHITLPVSKFYEYPSLYTDEDGNVYIAERHGDQLFIVSPDGKIIDYSYKEQMSFIIYAVFIWTDRNNNYLYAPNGTNLQFYTIFCR
ncbi:uncharacterized protein [Mytilus edulis]|uniref:uncharacterized protein n=1 Tax=Mytilus edulis TaxID=6550 RepID=UPI0039F0BE2A